MSNQPQEIQWNEDASGRKVKPFNFDPLIKASEAFAKLEKSYREKAVAAAPTVNKVDAEIEIARRNFNEEIQSIGRWRQARREQLMEELERIDIHHNEMVGDYTERFASRLKELYVKRGGAQTMAQFRPANNFVKPEINTKQPMRHIDHYNDEFEFERFTMGDLFGGVPVSASFPYAFPCNEKGQDKEREDEDAKSIDKGEERKEESDESFSYWMDLPTAKEEEDRNTQMDEEREDDEYDSDYMSISS
jgi:hypothetical protein